MRLSKDGGNPKALYLLWELNAFKQNGVKDAVSTSPIGLPDDFQFSQSSLQDFVDCPRRFYLKYIRQLRYPAPESAPLRAFEASMERGAQFHHLIHQHQIGIPTEALAETIPDDVTEVWWNNYLNNALADLPARRFPEITLSAPLAGRRLVAKYDLLAIGDDRAVIVDWKTAHKRPKRERLQHRLQTVVYPYLLTRAGTHLNDKQPISPDKISMIYWFAEYPQQPEIFAYSMAQFESDGVLLEGMAADILRRNEGDFSLTDNLDLCKFCAYRSLNDRGAKAGNLLAADTNDEGENDDFDLDFDLDQIAEIEF